LEHIFTDINITNIIYHLLFTHYCSVKMTQLFSMALHGSPRANGTSLGAHLEAGSKWLHERLRLGETSLKTIH
jgi:hypothetical protein